MLNKGNKKTWCSLAVSSLGGESPELKRDKYEGLIYYMGGAFINLVLICISLNVKNNILVSTFILLLNVFCFLNSVLPLGDKSDIKLWYKLYENN